MKTNSPCHTRSVFVIVCAVVAACVGSFGPAVHAAEYFIMTGPEQGAQPLVRQFFPAPDPDSFLAYASSFTGGVRVAAGDFDNDGFNDVVTGTGPGAAHVKVFDGMTHAELRSFLAYGGFTGGVYVAAGDVNNDGFSDIITGAGAGAAGGHVKAFSGQDGSEIRSFLAYGAGFAGGVRVAAGDLDGDGFAEIVAGTGPDGGSHVKVFDGATNAERMSFFAYEPSFTTGVYVAAIPVPEPSTLLLGACGAIAIALCARRRRR